MGHILSRGTSRHHRVDVSYPCSSPILPGKRHLREPPTGPGDGRQMVQFSARLTAIPKRPPRLMGNGRCVPIWLHLTPAASWVHRPRPPAMAGLRSAKP